MTFKKNYEREALLLSHWNLGFTVKNTSLMTGIPEGSISHYFARFNKNPKFYREQVGTQNPPRTSTPDLVNAAILYSNVNQMVNYYVLKEKFDKARDVLMITLLQMEFNKKMLPVIQNADPDKWDEFFRESMNVFVAFSQMQKMWEQQKKAN